VALSGAKLARDAGREFDLVVFGASGYTGRLVAAAVAQRAAADTRWAIAGRDRERLARVGEELRVEHGVTPDRIVADALDPHAMGELANRSRAVVTTVGPYARYGSALVEACASAGTDYADLTAEASWMRAMILAWHDRARERGARIVHACGFDSVPSDLGVWVLQQEAVRRYGRPCHAIVHAFGPLAGGVSGGTVASAMDQAERLSASPDARRELRDADLLAPGGTPSRDPIGPLLPMRHAGIDDWTAPYPMAASNAKIVRRTRHLLGEPWGAQVSYLERVRLATWARAAAVTVATVSVVALARLAPVRRAAAQFLPHPGDGPSVERRGRGFFRSTLAGEVAGAEQPLVVRVECALDPGYGATSRMLAEVGLHLAEDPPQSGGGVLTPAVAAGEALLERLDSTGVHFRR